MRIAEGHSTRFRILEDDARPAGRGDPPPARDVPRREYRNDQLRRNVATCRRAADAFYVDAQIARVAPTVFAGDRRLEDGLLLAIVRHCRKVARDANVARDRKTDLEIVVVLLLNSGRAPRGGEGFDARPARLAQACEAIHERARRFACERARALRPYASRRVERGAETPAQTSPSDRAPLFRCARIPEE